MKLRIYLVQKVLNFFDYFQQREIYNFLKKKIKDKSIFFDVGAHHGETIKNLSKYFQIAQIHAFEASLENFNVLKKKVFNKNLDIKLNCIGLSNEKKVSNINQSLESSSTTLSPINKKSKYYQMKLNTLGIKDYSRYIKTTKTNLDTLDNYIKDIELSNKIDLLKIDTEGHELYVLLGAKRNLSNIRFIYFEHHYDDMLAKGYKFSEIDSFLRENNFVKVYKSKMFFRKTFEYVYELKK
jgi:FkbM family methyltransferase